MARKSKSAAGAEGTGGRDLIATASLIMASERPAIERLKLRQQMIDIRATAKAWHVASKFTDSMARFGGGSLLTAALLLFIDRRPHIAFVPGGFYPFGTVRALGRERRRGG